MSEELYTKESVLGKIGQKLREADDTRVVSKTWHKSAETKGFKRVVKTVDDDEYDDIKETIEKIYADNISYMQYKPLFKKLCYYGGIDTNGVLLKKPVLKKGKDGKNVFIFTYTRNRKPMTLSGDSGLYHQTRNKLEVNELKPFFRGKADKGYLYEKPRIYFSLSKNMSRFCADYKRSESKIYKYRVLENISMVYVDPLVWSYPQGAVYVETDQPIKVDLIAKEERDVKKESVIDDDSKELEDFKRNWFNECDEEPEYSCESVSAFMGKHLREKKSSNNIKNEYDKIVGGFKKGIEIKEINPKEYDSIANACNTVSTKDISYVKYKLAFTKICKFVGIPSENTCIHNIKFTNKNDKKYIEVRYSTGSKRILIQNGVYLTTTSASKIDEVKPVFKSKSCLYSSPRAYFKISREIVSDDLDKKNIRYTPEELVRTAYIDMSFKDEGGKVFIETKLPIPVIPFYEKIVKKLIKQKKERIE